MRLLLTRPRAESEALAVILHASGFATMTASMIEIEAVPGAILDLQGAQAILSTSANGVRALAAATHERDLPVYAVGRATATAARAAGFGTVRSADGDVAALAGLVRAHLDPAAGALVHVAGSDLAGDLSSLLSAAGFTVRRAVLYRARTARALDPAAIEALASGAIAGVIFFSPRTARTFVNLAGEADVAGHVRRIPAYCLSDAVANAASALEWSTVRVANKPDQESLLALLPSHSGAAAPINRPTRGRA
jgi:uroporphyrinogen-III synthase